jgi:DNA-binding XRE family transcriptional regulator
VTRGQCREARDRLQWTQADLATAASVPAEIVAMFEDNELVGMMD